MNQSFQPYVSRDAVSNVVLSDAQKAQAFANQYQFTSRIAAVKVVQDNDADPWTLLPKLQAIDGYDPNDALRYVLVFDEFPQDSHDVGYILKRLNNPSVDKMQRFREFVADVCNTVSTNNPNAGADQDALVATLLGNIAAPAVEQSFKVLA